jgi:nucleotide-binding universal stress UspA family protein
VRLTRSAVRRYISARKKGGLNFLSKKAMWEDTEKQMKRLVKRKKLKPAECRVLILKGGDPATMIANQARRSRVSMIVMGSHGRTGFKRLILGSVAERTLRYASCPVLIVKR